MKGTCIWIVASAFYVLTVEVHIIKYLNPGDYHTTSENAMKPLKESFVGHRFGKKIIYSPFFLFTYPHCLKAQYHFQINLFQQIASVHSIDFLLLHWQLALLPWDVE